jgi:hypothetical protein
VLAPPPLLRVWVFVPLAAAMLVPAGLAAITGWSTGNARIAAAAALWSGLVGGLLVFVIWVTDAYAEDGRPYDAQLVRDFHRSGAHDLTSYAIGDSIGAALGLLLVIPVVALALGSLCGRSAARRGPAWNASAVHADTQPGAS